MKSRTDKRLAKVLTAAAAALLLASRSSAAVLDVSIAGYYGGNFLSDTTSALPDGTTVDFGLFYLSGFTSVSAITTALASANSVAAMQAFRSSNGWVSFASTTVQGNNFEISMTANSSTGLEMSPTTGTLASQSLVGKTAFLWIQTPTSSNEFGVYYFKSLLPSTSGFGDRWSSEATSIEATALVGTTNPDGVGTKAVSASATTVTPVLVMKSRGTPSLSGTTTTVTHRFAVNTPGTYTLEYTANLASSWSSKAVVVSSTADFDVTFTNPGINSVSDWTNRMFFRIRSS
jgi:hypothetical protein